MKTLLKVLMLTLLTANSYGAGFRLSEQSAKANGMGNSFVAVADDASAVWYNPAAMTELEKTQLSLGTVMVYPMMKHEYTGGSDEISKTLHIPPYLYATHKYSDKFSFGLGVNAPFGLSTEWDSATSATRTTATKSEVKAINANLNGAYKVSDKLSVAAGLNYISFEATLNKKLEGTVPGIYNIEQTLEGDGTAWGYNLAAFYKANEKWNFGANYRSQAKIDVDGKINVSTSGVLASIAATNKDATTEITLPDTFQMGVAYKHNEKWLYSFTMDYTNWTTYRSIVIDYVKDNGATAQSVDTKNWKSVWAYRFGTEYKYSDNLKLRGGIFYDCNPVLEKYFETRIPDSNRLAFSVGAGYAKENWVFDFSYTYLHFLERDVDSATNTLDGTYTAKAHLPAFSATYKF